MRKGQTTRLVNCLILAVIGGIVAILTAPLWPGMSDPGPNRRADVLQTIRAMIEIHNAQNPGSPYDETTPPGADFWDRLIDGNYMQAMPINHSQHGSTLVVSSPRMGAGWVWTKLTPDKPWAIFTIYMIDEAGNFWDYDGDGKPD